MSSHSLFSPSSIERTAACPASLIPNALLPEEDSIYSALGTFLHKISDRCSRTNTDAEQWLAAYEVVRIEGRAVELKVDDELASEVQKYLDYFRSIEGEHFHEQRVEVTDFLPVDLLAQHPYLPQERRQSGTLDHAVLSADRQTLHIIDAKFGEGVPVYAPSNPQLVYYALGWLRDYVWLAQPLRVVLHICQPRRDHFDSWATTPAELRRIAASLYPRLRQALLPGPPYVPGEKACQFCKLSGQCRAQAEQLESHRALQFDAALQDFHGALDVLTDDELVDAYLSKKLWSSRYAAIERVLHRQVLAGRLHDRLKLVEGRTYRRWRSIGAAYAAMEDAGIPDAERSSVSPISPKQALALAGKERADILADAILKPPGKPTLAEADDPRPEYGGVRAADVFDDYGSEGGDLEDLDDL